MDSTGTSPPLRERLRWLRHWWTLRRSGLFLFDYYRSDNPDLPPDTGSLLLHYIRRGGFEGRKPNPYFDSPWYLDRDPELRRLGLNPLYHYCRHGAAEGRDPGPHFSGARYLSLHADVRRSGMNPLRHYLWHGLAEGRPTGLES